MANGVIRRLTDKEHEVFSRLLSPEFPGKDSLFRQLKGLKVEQLDDSGCLALNPVVRESASVEHRIPMEATYVDTDGVTTHVDLHVVDGLLFALELYKEDGTAVKRRPHAAELVLFCPTDPTVR